MAAAPKFPDFRSVQGLSEYLAQFSAWADRELRLKLSRETAVASILLASPDGSVYTVAVDDAGVIIATKVSQG